MAPPPRRRRAAALAAAALLLLAMAAQLGSGIVSDGLTHDELLYVAAGRRHLAFSDYRVNPDQPPLAKMLAAAALPGVRDSAPAEGEYVLDWAFRFVHRDNDARSVITRARIPVALVTLLMAGLVCAWAWRQHGAAAALAALALVAFDPSLLAHGHLAATDAAAAATMIGTAYAFHRWCRAPSAWLAGATGILLGLAVATRLTGWLLLPAFLLVGATRIARTPATARAWLWSVPIAALCAWAVVWLAFGLHFEPWTGVTVMQEVAPKLGLPGRLLSTLHAWRLLPDAYLEGARFQLAHGLEGDRAYLLGGFSDTGWRHYYLVALLVKSTPAFLVAAAAGLALLWRRRRELDAELDWLVLAAVVLLVASLGRIDLGERYVLVVRPLLALVAASAVPLLMRRRAGLTAVVVLLLAHAASALSAAPGGYLAYFNVLAGGTHGGHRVLLDSNLDWGQDLPRLGAWMRREGVDRVQLAYHGSDDPDRWGVTREDAPGVRLYPTRPGPRTARVLAVSPDLLLGLSHPRDPYAALRERTPDARAGVFFIFRDPPLIEAPDRRP